MMRCSFSHLLMVESRCSLCKNNTDTFKTTNAQKASHQRTALRGSLVVWGSVIVANYAHVWVCALLCGPVLYRIMLVAGQKLTYTITRECGKETEGESERVREL